MTKEIRVFAKEREITQKNDGKKVKVLEYSYTPNGEKFIDVVFRGVSKPNKPGYWLVKVDTSKISPKNGKPVYRDNGEPVISKKTGMQLIKNDVWFVNEVISLKFDEDYEKIRAEKQQADVEAVFNLENDEKLPF